MITSAELEVSSNKSQKSIKRSNFVLVNNQELRL